ncbi:MAG: hypothetical protein V5A46_06135 [Haloferacaceae archaeon]
MPIDPGAVPVIDPGAVLASDPGAVPAIDPGTLLFATAAATAVVGAAVAAVAYRGYRRNDSEAMRFLAVAIACIAVGPFLVTYVLGPAFSLSDAGTLLGVLSVTILGLLSVIYSLEGT